MESAESDTSNSTSTDSDDELTRVKRENKALREEVKMLSEVVTQSERRLDACNQTLQDITSLRKPFLQPPPEILHMIFERTILPHFLLDPSTSLSPNSMWCKVLQQKKSIVNVCRLWNEAGLPFLYEDICIRRIYQFSNLLQTLESASNHHRNLVTRISFYCLVPMSYGQQFGQQLRLLFLLCPRLQTFAYISSCPLPASTSLSAILPAVTNLQLGDGVQIGILENILGTTAPNLISLSIRIQEINYPGAKRGNQISFPRLEEISFGVTSIALHIHPTFDRDWNMPLLKRITFRLHGSGTGSIPTGALKLFCEAYGSRVTFLHVHPEYVWSMPDYTIDMQSLLDSCPALEHVVVHPRTLAPLTHKRVKWVDIWGPHPLSSCLEDWAILGGVVTNSSFPMLTGVRVLSPGVASLYNLPTILPPNAVSTPADTFAYRFLQHEIRHDYAHILRFVPEWPSEDDQIDPDFEVDSGDSESSGSISLDWEIGSDQSIDVGWDVDIDQVAA